MVHDWHQYQGPTLGMECCRVCGVVRTPTNDERPCSGLIHVAPRNWNIKPVTETDDEIFVFGSNLAGRHGAGAAKHAKRHCAAQYGIGRGRTGRAYAIPTKDKALKVLPLSTIEAYCFAFTEYARGNPSLRFYVTPIGTGHAGYSVDDIAPFFAEMPMNCRLADTWDKGKQNA